jgi:hypothetical protein
LTDVHTTNLIGVQTLPALLFHFIVVVVVLPVVNICRIVVVQSDRGWYGFLVLQERQSTHQATPKIEVLLRAIVCQSLSCPNFWTQTHY